MFEQRASGEFTIEVVGEYHCGPDHTSPKKFEYECVIEWPNNALDPNGFLLDNLTFKRFFDNCMRTHLSCEKLAKYCGDKIWELTGGRALRCYTSIIPFKGVRITYSCGRS